MDVEGGQSNLINDSIEWEKQKMMKNEKQSEGRKMVRIAQKHSQKIKRDILDRASEREREMR